MPLTHWNFPFCPQPPDWELTWEQIETEFEWLQPLRKCPQGPSLQGENNVLTHTRKVCEALVSNHCWRSLLAVERALIFAAALLHDIAKPECTVIDGDNQVSCPGHRRRGMHKARMILWDDVRFQTPSVPFLIREMIVNLIRHLNVPVHWIDQPDPIRTALQASQSVRCDWLALLAEANVEGQDDSRKLGQLEKIDLFRELCRENNCLAHPYAFPSDHSRFVFFRSEPGKLPYDAYDTNQFDVVLLAGIPAAGKDTWVLDFAADRPIISLDDLRLSLDISPVDNQGPVVVAAKAQAREYLRRQQPFIWNATNITAAVRTQLIDLFAAYQARTTIVYLEAPLQTILQRNAQRTAVVPNRVIYKLAAKLDIPSRTEAHGVHYIVDGTALENWWHQWPIADGSLDSQIVINQSDLDNFEP
ncbi:MAG TPA: AAA family ATPase [Acidobacteriota bacterium]|nr:AAA family ATPase [Acidobacteriota bacterium]